mmetsp:Transcript_103181/g.274330  ORF Transcript_103181/g.274330 Transcript_103181/m.274330 type:complete len:235 (+) Transcript_103181:69-773(+)
MPVRRCAAKRRLRLPARGCRASGEAPRRVPPQRPLPCPRPPPPHRCPCQRQWQPSSPAREPGRSARPPAPGRRLPARRPGSRNGAGRRGPWRRWPAPRLGWSRGLRRRCGWRRAAAGQESKGQAPEATAAGNCRLRPPRPSGEPSTEAHQSRCTRRLGVFRLLASEQTTAPPPRGGRRRTAASPRQRGRGQKTPSRLEQAPPMRPPPPDLRWACGWLRPLPPALGGRRGRRASP